MGVLHETGHALYERGLPAAWRGQPVGEARGMVLHESQSLLIEMQVCRSRAFLAFAAPLLRETFGGAGPAWEADNLYRHYTRVAPGFIRVDADEVTYPAHVILRYDLERAMIAGDLLPADLPGAWNDGMQRLLGLTAARRPPRLPAGHPLVRRRLGLLPDLHAGRHGGGADLRGGGRGRAAHSRGDRRRRVRAAGRLAAPHVHAKGSCCSTRALLIDGHRPPLEPAIPDASPTALPGETGAPLAAALSRPSRT